VHVAGYADTLHMALSSAGSGSSRLQVAPVGNCYPEFGSDLTAFVRRIAHEFLQAYDFDRVAQIVKAARKLTKSALQIEQSLLRRPSRVDE